MIKAFNYCPQCRTKQNPNNEYCPHCGLDFSRTTVQVPQQISQVKTKNVFGSILKGLGNLVLILLASPLLLIGAVIIGSIGGGIGFSIFWVIGEIFLGTDRGLFLGIFGGIGGFFIAQLIALGILEEN